MSPGAMTPPSPLTAVAEDPPILSCTPPPIPTAERQTDQMKASKVTSIKEV